MATTTSEGKKKPALLWLFFFSLGKKDADGDDDE
jgi:hypothetical protein